MPRVKANGVELFYDERGPADAPVVLLVMGLGTQMIAWPKAFCDRLAAAGYRVIRYDNRDIGLSTAMDGAIAMNPLMAAMMAHLLSRSHARSGGVSGDGGGGV